MQLGWIDFSKEDRQKAFDVINLLSEQGAVDELGIGVIRDAFANYFFPGTSTIQTRAKPICDFLDYLVTNVHNTSNNAGKKRNLIRGLCADIKDVSFSLDSKIFGENFEVLPLGIGKNAYRMQEDILFCKERGNANSTFNELVVMSPFLSESVIADFNLTDRALSDCKRTLVTRCSELGKLKASDVDNFTIYALKDEIIDGEEEISDELADKKKQDIHAKIYLRRKYSDVDL